MILLMALAGGQDGATPDPVAPALKGMLQCYAPDDAKKTCESLAGYVALGNGTYRNDTTHSLGNPLIPMVTLRLSRIVRVGNGAICGTMTERDLLAGKLFLDGKPVAEGREAPITVSLDGPLAEQIGKEVCTSYTPGADDVLIANITVAGVVRPDLQQKMRWVRPDEGYRFSPWPDQSGVQP